VSRGAGIAGAVGRRAQAPAGSRRLGGGRFTREHEMKTGTILVNLSGRGDKHMDYVNEHWGTGEG